MDSEQIILEASRNILSFSLSSLSETEINYSICNNPLQKIIKSILADIKNILPDTILSQSNNNNNNKGKNTFEIRANEFNWSLRLSTNSEKVIEYILKSYLEEEKCVYLEIKNIVKQNKKQSDTIIHKAGKFKDILDLEYHPLSFRQPDDNIRNWIIHFFQNEFYELKANCDRWQILICIGGECTLFGKIISSIHRKYFLTDFQSIYNDLKYNYSGTLNNPNKLDNLENILLIDYKTVSIDWEKYNCDLGKSVIIANTGYQGLGENLASQLAISKISVIYIISCNETSFQKDFVILGQRYIVDRKIEIRTNYSVWIYKLTYK
jgi:hypothetical protein